MLLVVEIIVETSQPGCQPLDGNLVLWMHIDELAHALCEPFETDLLLAPAGKELFDSSISEVHA